MHIEVNEFHLTLNEKEVRTFIFALRDKFKNSISHCVIHTGYETLVYNYKDDMEMMHQLCIRIGRPELYTREIDAIKKEIDKQVKATEANNVA